MLDGIRRTEETARAWEPTACGSCGGEPAEADEDVRAPACSVRALERCGETRGRVVVATLVERKDPEVTDRVTEFRSKPLAFASSRASRRSPEPARTRRAHRELALELLGGCERGDCTCGAVAEPTRDRRCLDRARHRLLVLSPRTRDCPEKQQSVSLPYLSTHFAPSAQRLFEQLFGLVEVAAPNSVKAR